MMTFDEMTHVPMCQMCREREVVGSFTFNDGLGFCSDECHTEYMNTEYDTMLDAHVAQEQEREEREADDMFAERPEYDDFLSQYDDDPSPYGGTYSEE
jgi:hypothetical protein